MSKFSDLRVVCTLARRTFSHTVESPIAFICAVFFYGFIGLIFSPQFFANNNASIDGVGALAPWLLWFVVPALTMGLISDEIRSGTFEHLSTLPLRDWEIVLGKFKGFALFAFFLIGGLVFYPLLIASLAHPGVGLDWGASLGTLLGLLLICFFYGAMGLFASSLAKNQVVAFILGVIFCTFFFFIGQFSGLFPGFLSQVADFLGVGVHLNTLSRGVFDIRDFLYFGSMTFLFLYFSVIRLSSRRF